MCWRGYKRVWRGLGGGRPPPALALPVAPACPPSRPAAPGPHQREGVRPAPAFLRGAVLLQHHHALQARGGAARTPLAVHQVRLRLRFSLVTNRMLNTSTCGGGGGGGHRMCGPRTALGPQGSGDGGTHAALGLWCSGTGPVPDPALVGTSAPGPAPGSPAAPGRLSWTGGGSEPASGRGGRWGGPGLLVTARHPHPKRKVHVLDQAENKASGAGALSADPAQQPPGKTGPSGERWLEEGGWNQELFCGPGRMGWASSQQGPPHLIILNKSGVADFDREPRLGHVNHGHNGFDILHLIPLISFQGQLVLIGCRPESITTGDHLGCSPGTSKPTPTGLTPPGTQPSPLSGSPWPHSLTGEGPHVPGDVVAPAGGLHPVHGARVNPHQVSRRCTKRYRDVEA